ncbi:MAG: alpha-amylase family glycosyl hydrolase [Pseudomonadota bacterium]
MADQDWWRGSVTYQIYPRSFMDARGSGIGDLKGITDRLGYVADLGVDAIWLSPIFTSPMKDMGYDVSDYRGIDPVFGTLGDFDKMLARAHELGLKVIIDQVLSHSSDQHPAFTESRASRDNPKADWYVWADPKADGAPPNNWTAIFGGIAWEWDARRRQYYFHNFLKEQPDFNFHNPEVQDYHLDNMRFWLERGVDGFRHDTVNFYFHDARLPDDPADHVKRDDPARRPYDMQYHLHSKNQPENLAFLSRMRALLDSYDARAMVGEVGDSHHSIELMGQYTSPGRLHMAYSFEMLGPSFSPSFFRERIEAFFKGAPKGWPCWAFSNHDVMRHLSRWQAHKADDASLAKLAAGMLLSFSGSVCLYQGEELGQLETDLEYSELTDPEGLTFWPELKGRDGCRTPMVWDAERSNGGFSVANKTWLPIKPPQLARAVKQQGADSVLAFYKAMLALRRATPALRDAPMRFVDAEAPILAYWRGETVLCVFNLAPAEARLALDGTFAPLVHERAELHADALVLGPNGLAILRAEG